MQFLSDKEEQIKVYNDKVSYHSLNASYDINAATRVPTFPVVVHNSLVAFRISLYFLYYSSLDWFSLGLPSSL